MDPIRRLPERAGRPSSQGGPGPLRERGEEAGRWCRSAVQPRHLPPEPALRAVLPPGPRASLLPPLTSLHRQLRAPGGSALLPPAGRAASPGCGVGNPGIPPRGGGCCPGPGPGVGSRSGAFSLFRCLKLAPAERCGHVTGVANRRRPCFRDPPRRLGGRCGPARQVRLLGRRERPVRWPRRAVRSAERRRVRQVSWRVGTAGEAAAGEAEPRGAGARLLGRALEGSAAAGRGDTGYHGQAPQPSGP